MSWLAAIMRGYREPDLLPSDELSSFSITEDVQRSKTVEKAMGVFRDAYNNVLEQACASYGVTLADLESGKHHLAYVDFFPEGLLNRSYYLDGKLIVQVKTTMDIGCSGNMNASFVYSVYPNGGDVLKGKLL